MAFGQSSGPPATGKQLNELLELLEAAGHSDFRDARGPMGFTQRQAGGKFSRDEADEFIEQLQAELYGDGPPADSKPSTRAEPPQSKIAPRKERTSSSQKRTTPQQRAAAAKRASSSKAPSKAPSKGSKTQSSLKDVSTEELAAELQSRGWVVLEP